jgi:hypothetical protein
MPEPITAILFRRIGAMEVKAIFPVRSSTRWFVRRYGPPAAPDQTDPSAAPVRMGEDVRARCPEDAFAAMRKDAAHG